MEIDLPAAPAPRAGGGGGKMRKSFAAAAAGGASASSSSSSAKAPAGPVLVSASELRAEAAAIKAATSAASSAAGGAGGVAASSDSSAAAAAGGPGKPKFPALNAAALGVSSATRPTAAAAGRTAGTLTPRRGAASAAWPAVRGAGRSQGGRRRPRSRCAHPCLLLPLPPCAAPRPATPAPQKGRDEMRSIRVPGHRYTPLKEHWETIVKPIVGASGGRFAARRIVRRHAAAAHT
jgi:hypothetical protein